MTNREQVKRDMAIAFDFVEQIIDNPELVDKIPEGATITFLDEGNTITEKNIIRAPERMYVKVKRNFEIL